MIKTILLILKPAPTWERIGHAHQSVASVFFRFFLPLLVIVSAGELYGISQWAKVYSRFGKPVTLSLQTAGDFVLTQALLTLLVLFLGAYIVKAFGETFHSRHSYSRAFAALAYSLGPLLLFRLLHAAPFIRWWMVWGIGIFFTLAVLYYGLVRVMQPDPTHALGMYFMSAMLIFVTTFLAQLVASLVLKGKLEIFAPLIS